MPDKITTLVLSYLGEFKVEGQTRVLLFFPHRFRWRSTPSAALGIHRNQAFPECGATTIVICFEDSFAILAPRTASTSSCLTCICMGITKTGTMRHRIHRGFHSRWRLAYGALGEQRSCEAVHDGAVASGVCGCTCDYKHHILLLTASLSEGFTTAATCYVRVR